ncbi:unnamed protein product, partial [Urochloa humidicola]
VPPAGAFSARAPPSRGLRRSAGDSVNQRDGGMQQPVLEEVYNPVYVLVTILPFRRFIVFAIPARRHLMSNLWTTDEFL